MGRWWALGSGARTRRGPPRPAPPRRTRWPCAGDYKRTATEVADGLRALFGFLPELGVGRPRAALHQPWILARERGDDLVHRNIGVGTVVAQVLHVTAAAPVVGVKERVRPAVELEGADSELVAEHAIEGRRRLHPPAGHRHLGVAVIVEDVSADQRPQPGRAEVIAHVGEADPSRNAARARDGGEHRRLADAEPVSTGQHRARAEGVERVEITVGRVDDPVADGVERRTARVTSSLSSPAAWRAKAAMFGAALSMKAVGSRKSGTFGVYFSAANTSRASRGSSGSRAPLISTVAPGAASRGTHPRPPPGSSAQA